MKKLKSILIVMSLFLLTACTVADLDNFLDDLNKNVASSDYTPGEHFHYIRLPETYYYSASEIELYTHYYSMDSYTYNLRVGISGTIYNKVNAPLTAVVQYPLYDSNGNVVRKIAKQYNAMPYDMIDIYLVEDEDFTNRKYFLKKDQVTIAIYCQGQLVGTNRPELITNRGTEMRTRQEIRNNTQQKNYYPKKNYNMKRTRQTLY